MSHPVDADTTPGPERDPEMDHAVMMRRFGRYVASIFLSAAFLMAISSAVSMTIGSRSRSDIQTFDSAVFALTGVCLIAGSMGYFSWRRRVLTLTEDKMTAFKRWHVRMLMFGGLIVAIICGLGFFQGFSNTAALNTVFALMVAVQPAAFIHWRFVRFVQWVDLVGYPLPPTAAPKTPDA